MKLLLTSQGITNKSIEKKFFEMVGKKPEDIYLSYVPTAVNMAPVDDKRWMVENIQILDLMGIGTIDIVDFSAIPKESWRERFGKSDVIFVEGGSVPPLLSGAKKVGLDKLFPEILKNKVYVGCSAGSQLVCEVVTAGSRSSSAGIWHDKGFGFVDFSIRPHFNRSDRSFFTEDIIAKIAKEYASTFYAIDDNTAIAVVDNRVEVVSEGKWKIFEK